MRALLGLVALSILGGCAQHGCSAAPHAIESTLPALRTLRRGEGDGPVVVLLHGMGSRPEDMVSFADRTDLPVGTRFVFPYAPTPTHPSAGREGGFVWWSLGDDFADPRRHRYPAMEVVRRQVIALLDELEVEYGVTSDRIVLGGFSQGAMLATDLALHDARPLAGLALMSGTFLSEGAWRPRFASRRGLRTMISHGSHDPLLPFAASAELEQALKQAGWDVTFVPFRGQHEIPPIVLQALGRLITEAT